MKRIMNALAAVAILAATLAIPTQVKAALVSYNSGFQVQNLEGTTATVTITFYNLTGGTTTASVQDTIAGNSSDTYFPLQCTGGNPGDPGLPGTCTIPSGWQGSVVISSDKKLAAITNIVGSDGTNPLAFGASYNGFTGGNNSAYVPLLMKDNFGFNTWMSVQNTGSAATTITVNYSDGVQATASSVQPGAAAKFEQSTEAHAAGWVGSATISGGGQPVALTVLEVGPDTLFAYDGFGSGSTLPVMPLINMNNFGYVTGAQIQNIDTTAATTVTVAYTPAAPPLGAGTACTEVRVIPAQQSVSYGLYVFTNFTDPAPLISSNCVEGETFIGSARVTANSANVQLVGIVNQLNIAAQKGAAYNMLAPTDANRIVVFPLIMDDNYEYLTGFNIVNVGSNLTAGAVTCLVSGKDGSGNPVTKNYTSPAMNTGGGWSQITNDVVAADVAVGAGFVGSATCTGPTGTQVLGMVNELNLDGTNFPGDTLFVYEGTTSP